LLVGQASGHRVGFTSAGVAVRMAHTLPRERRDATEARCAQRPFNLD
jgi:hypothetical protein